MNQSKKYEFVKMVYLLSTIFCLALFACSSSSVKKENKSSEEKYSYTMLDSADKIIHSGTIQIRQTENSEKPVSIINIDSVYAADFYINNKISGCKTETNYDKRTGYTGIKFCPDATDDNVYFTLDLSGNTKNSSWSHITYAGIKSKGILIINKLNKN
ncbi:MAG: hypothetical protein IT281_00400 [Ignavibacteria bacterium]|nr:hypothetical protein [Ignavibacteria bacterium]